VLIRLSDEEYILSGNGVVVEFAAADAATAEAAPLGEDGFLLSGTSASQPSAAGSAATTEPQTRVGLASVDEVAVNADGTLTLLRRLNGDQTHQGRHARISVGEYKTLYIRLYKYK
jgi:hypothetical protein